MFTRTDNGLSNRSLFTRSNFTMYVEGGGGIPGSGSSDFIFWGDILKTTRPDITLTIKPHGGKPQLEKIAHKVKNGDVTRTIVAMDSDYDLLLGDIIDHPNVLYTYGYSWENDALDIDNLEITLSRLLKGEVISRENLERIQAEARNAIDSLNQWVNADFWLRSMNSSLFPGMSEGKFIGNHGEDRKISISRKELWSECKRRLKLIPIHAKKDRPETWILCTKSFLQGHVIQFFINCAVKYAMTAVGKRKKSFTGDHIEAIMISIMCDRIGVENCHKGNHYIRQSTRIQ